VVERRDVANRDMPQSVPVRRMGGIPVIVRVSWVGGGEEWRAAKAVRWTSTHVMVMWRDDPGVHTSERYEWLRAMDVVRSVTWFVAPGQA
jgi:hypothetical protein